MKLLSDQNPNFKPLVPLRSANPKNFRTPRRFHADSAPLRLGGLCVFNAFWLRPKAALCHPRLKKVLK